MIPRLMVVVMMMSCLLVVRAVLMVLTVGELAGEEADPTTARQSLTDCS